ncbi:MAG TPA: recombinase family protein [Nonomuraea sp.]|nr:recombinase family protein [Nonomuraea sp.]
MLRIRNSWNPCSITSVVATVHQNSPLMEPVMRTSATSWLRAMISRGAAELLAIAEELRRSDIQLELLTGPLQGVYDPSGHGAALFAFFAGMAESEREYIREKSLEGQASARERGRHGGRPKVFDEDMAAYARSLRERGVPVPEIAAKLVIPTGKNKGRNPSLASVYRVLADEETGQAEETGEATVSPSR